MLKLASPENVDKTLEAAGISANERAENLSVDALLKLSDCLNGVM